MSVIEGARRVYENWKKRQEALKECAKCGGKHKEGECPKVIDLDEHRKG